MRILQEKNVLRTAELSVENTRFSISRCLQFPVISNGFHFSLFLKSIFIFIQKGHIVDFLKSHQNRHFRKKQKYKQYSRPKLLKQPQIDKPDLYNYALPLLDCKSKSLFLLTFKSRFLIMKQTPLNTVTKTWDLYKHITCLVCCEAEEEAHC